MESPALAELVGAPPVGCAERTTSTPRTAAPDRPWVRQIAKLGWSTFPQVRQAGPNGFHLAAQVM